MVEPGAVEFANELAAEKDAPNLRQLLGDELLTAHEKMPAAPAAVPSDAGGGLNDWIQWLIVWVSFLTAAHFWLGLEIGAWWPNPGYRWGLYGYLYPAYTNHPGQFAFVILVVGGLLLWQISARRVAGAAPVRSIAALSTRALVFACLVVLLLLLALEFRPVAQSRTPSRGYGTFGRNSFGNYFGKF